MNLYQILNDFGALVHGELKGNAKKVWTVDLKTREWVFHKEHTFPFFQIIGRANEAKDYPNPTFDTAKFILDSESTFWEVHLPLFKPGLTRAVRTFLSDPKTPKDLDQGEWVELLYDGTPVGEIPEVGPSCFDTCMARYREKLAAPDVDSEPSLVSGRLGIGKVKARLQPIVSGIGLKNSTGKLFSVNEGANEFLNTTQGLNYLTTLDEAMTVIEGMNYSLANNSIHTSDSSTLLVPLNGEKSHPIIKPLQGLLGFGYTEVETSVLWAELLALPEDDTTQFFMLQVKPSMTRMVLRHLKMTTASEIRENVLRFRSEVNFWESDKVTLRNLLTNDKFELIVSEGVAQDTLWAVLSGGTYPAQLKSISYNRYQFTSTRWMKAMYYRENHLRPENRTSMSNESNPANLTFNHELKGKELPIMVATMNQYVPQDLREELAYTLGRIIATHDHLRMLYHIRKANGKKIKVPECREIRFFRSNPAQCFSSMDPVLYYSEAPSEYKALMDSLKASIKKKPPTRPLPASQMTLLLLGFEHQRAGLDQYTRMRSAANKAREKDKKPSEKSNPAVMETPDAAE